MDWALIFEQSLWVEAIVRCDGCMGFFVLVAVGILVYSTRSPETSSYYLWGVGSLLVVLAVLCMVLGVMGYYVEMLELEQIMPAVKEEAKAEVLAQKQSFAYAALLLGIGTAIVPLGLGCVSLIRGTKVHRGAGSKSSASSE